MYEELVKRLREYAADGYMLFTKMGEAMNEAAGAIEELQGEVKSWYLDYMELLPTRWYSVEEQLPEPNTRVIGFMAWKAITAVEYQHNNWYSIDHIEPLPKEAVTHWMPLPEPPKEEQDGT